MTVSILGCGWYGLALAKTLIADGVVVKGSTTTESKLSVLAEDGVQPFYINLTDDYTAYNPNFFVCDVLVVSVPPKSRSGEGGAYLSKLEQVIKAIKQHAIQKVILISSTGVYADLNREVNESTEPEPNTPSGIILFAAEQLFKKEMLFKTTIIRFGGLIGPERDPGRFFAGKENIPNGLAPVNMIHQTDCIGFTLAILNKQAFGYLFNACTPHHPPKFAFYTQAAAKSGLEQPEFLAELKEWKIVSSINTKALLDYQYQIQYWYEWLKQD